VSATPVRFDPPKGAVHPLRGFGAQFNTNFFTSAGESPDVSKDEVDALLATIKRLRPGHSRIFVRPDAREQGNERTALMRTIDLADRAGANVNLTWWKGPFPHAPQPGHVEKRKQLMDDFAAIIKDARAKAATTHITIMNEVNSYDIAKALQPLKTMQLYEALYRDLHESLARRSDPLDGSKTLAETVQLIGGDLVEKGPGRITVNKQRFPYGPSSQNDWLDYMRHHMADVLDGYSIHVYWQPDEFPKRPTTRLENLAKLGIKKPVFITEYGVRWRAARPRPGTIDMTPGGLRMERSSIAAFQHAWFNALAPQYGVAGLSKWVLYKTTKKGEFGEWGMIGPRTGAPAFDPAPSCDVFGLFNDLVLPQWTPDGFGYALDGSVLASRFKGSGTKRSVIVLNAGTRAVQVQVPGLPKNSSVFAADWNNRGKGKRRSLPRSPTDAQGNATVTVPPQGFVGLSTVALA